MRKNLLFIGLLILLLSPLAAQSVEVVLPNGGSWTLGTLRTITWKPTNPGIVRVDIILRKGNSKVGVIKSQVPLAAGSLTWPVGKLEDGTMAPAGTDYFVRIRDAGNTFSDENDWPFTISPGSQPSPSPGGSLSPDFKKKIHIDVNTSFKPYVQLKPDLVVCKWAPGQLMKENLSSDAPPFAYFNFIVKIFNIGKAESKECWLKIAFNGGGGGSRKISPIKTGEATVQTFIINTRLDGSLSDKYTVWIDEKNDVDESNEGNNIFNGTLSVNLMESAKCSDGAAH